MTIYSIQKKPSNSPVTRRFADVDERVVHYRVGGNGPIVVALHESPRSSLSMMAVIDALADDFIVIAPDMPGYALSDPLGKTDLTITDHANALAEFLSEIGVEKAILYGTHTGAAIAAEFGILYPHRTQQVILDGFPLFTPQETEDILANYLPAFKPRWDGSHVMKLWSRIKDLTTFFPWYRHEVENRLSAPQPPTKFLQRTALGFIEAGQGYRDAYRAAFQYRSADALTELTVPVAMLANETDLLVSHLDQIPPTADCKIVRCKPGADWASKLAQLALKGMGSKTKISVPALAGTSNRRKMFEIGSAQIHVRMSGTGPADLPIVLLHDIPGSSEDFTDLLPDLAQMHPVYAIDMPGCGDSFLPDGDSPLVKACVAILEELLVQLNAEKCIMYGEGFGALMMRHLENQPRLTITHAYANDCNLRGRDIVHDVPDLLPQSNGTHLTGAWFQLRDALLGGNENPQPTIRGVTDEHSMVEVLDRQFRSLVKGPAARTLALALMNECGTPAERHSDIEVSRKDLVALITSIPSAVSLTDAAVQPR